MPMYEYQCDACGLVFEARQKFSDAPLAECTSCGGSVKKIVSKTAFSLQGGGWYQEGYSESPAATPIPTPAATPAPAAACPAAGAGCEGCPKAAANE
jgi:putative FmdB family regulatory protein